MCKQTFLTLTALILVLTLTSGCSLLQSEQSNSGTPLLGSGTVEAVQVVISPQIGGRIAEVMVTEGEFVEAETPLFRLEDDLLQTQRNQALAAINTATANLEVTRKAVVSAQVALDSANIQYDIELNSARLAYQPVRRAQWSQGIPDEFNLPVWYFEKSEEMTAAQLELQAAQVELDSQQKNFAAIVVDSGGTLLMDTEARLAEARAAFLIAQDVLNRAQIGDDSDLLDKAQSAYDDAESDLEAAQTAYDELLTEETADNLLQARASLSLAQERYETALDRYNQFFTGEDSLRIRAAEIAIQGAEAALEQALAQVGYAETAIDGAQAQLGLIDVQIEKLTILSPTRGVVISRSIQPGEIVQPGASGITLGQLDDLTITVYIPEDRYGQINLGMTATVVVDSFPGETFLAEVVRIADQAEFTPRNVQTEEGRRTTVFAVELSVQDTAGKLKPGMPADITFQE